jgi:hypothetical protein
MPKRPSPAPNLSGYAGEHLFYEAMMFVHARDMTPRDHLEMNVKVEVFGFHLRNLIEFFIDDKARTTDVSASNYIDQDEWKANRPDSPSLLAARRRLDKELAHLTSERIAGAPPEKYGICRTSPRSFGE